MQEDGVAGQRAWLAVDQISAWCVGNQRQVAQRHGRLQDADGRAAGPAEDHDQIAQPDVVAVCQRRAARLAAVVDLNAGRGVVDGQVADSHAADVGVDGALVAGREDQQAGAAGSVDEDRVGVCALEGQLVAAGVDHRVAVAARLHDERVGEPGGVQRRLEVAERVHAPGQPVVGAGRTVVVVHDPHGARSAELEDPARAGRVGRRVVGLAVAVEVARQPVDQKLAGELEHVVGDRLERHRGGEALSQPGVRCAVDHGQHVALAVAVEVSAAVGGAGCDVRAEAAG